MDKKKTKKVLGWLEEIVPGASLGVMSVLIFVQVINRYFIKYPIDWIEELAIYIYIWGTYLGLYTVTREGRHLEVKFIRELVGDGANRLILGLVYTVTILLCLYIAVFGGKMVYQMALWGETSAALQVPMAWIYASIPVGLGLMGIGALFKLKDLLTSEKNVSDKNG